MGWYATGSGGIMYKYGDVVALARSSGLGTLLVVPRVTTEDTDGELIEIDDLVFLGPLQQAIERSRLPWRHVEFTLDADPSGESIQVKTDFDPWRMLESLAGLVAEHADSVQEVFAAAASWVPEISQLTVSTEF